MKHLRATIVTVAAASLILPLGPARAADTSAPESHEWTKPKALTQEEGANWPRVAASADGRRLVAMWSVWLGDDGLKHYVKAAVSTGGGAKWSDEITVAETSTVVRPKR